MFSYIYFQFWYTPTLSSCLLLLSLAQKWAEEMSSYFNLDKYGTNPGRHLLQTNLVRILWGGLTATLVFLLLKATNAVKKYILQTPGQLLFHLEMYQIVEEISLILPNKCELQTLISSHIAKYRRNTNQTRWENTCRLPKQPDTPACFSLGPELTLFLLFQHLK